jgi:hypothetical protein
MDFKSGPTKFAPAERSTAKDIERRKKLVADSVFRDPTTRTMLNAVFDIVLILDKNRQAVFANTSLQKFLGIANIDSVLGYRPGEIFDCVHAYSVDTGCGTTDFCKFCGAVKSILIAQEGRYDVEECVVMKKDGSAVDLAVAAAPIRAGGDGFVFFAIRNISDQKRRELLEGVFFHDVLNVASIIWTATEMLKIGHKEKQEELIDKIHMATLRLIDEVKSQGNLSKAERSELAVDIREIKAMDMMGQAVSLYKDFGTSRGVRIEIEAESEDVAFKSDFILLRRVLGNMIKNAIEAAEKGEVVKIGSKRSDDSVEFRVNNKTVMPPEISMNIFKRSFSTKGKGRGLGTYSIKIFTERYLHGKADFTSESGTGTTFFVSYPLDPMLNK